MQSDATAQEELDRLLHLITHELKADVRGLTEIPKWIAEDCAASQDSLPAGVHDHLALMSASALRLSQSLESLTRFRRAGAADDTLRRERVADQVTAAANRIAAGIDLRLDCDGAEDAYCVPVTDMSPVWEAIIGNAVHHHCASDRAPAIVVKTATRGARVTVRVEDDGPGLEPQFRERVFDPFCRLARRSETQRAGMGLTIARRAVTRAGGSIRIVDPELLSGCAVLVDLPQA